MKKKAEGSEKMVKIQPASKDHEDDLLKKHSVQIEDINGYDAVYLYNMIKADYYGSSIKDEQQAALHIKDNICDVDGYDSKTFTHFYADCIAKGIPIMWEDMLQS